MKQTKFTKKQINVSFMRFSENDYGIPIDKAKELFGQEVVEHIAAKKPKPMLTNDEILAICREDELFNAKIKEPDLEPWAFRWAVEDAITRYIIFHDDEESVINKGRLAQDQGKNVIKTKYGDFLTYTGTVRAAENFNYRLKQKTT